MLAENAQNTLPKGILYTHVVAFWKPLSPILTPQQGPVIGIRGRPGSYGTSLGVTYEPEIENLCRNDIFWGTFIFKYFFSLLLFGFMLVISKQCSSYKKTNKNGNEKCLFDMEKLLEIHDSHLGFQFWAHIWLPRESQMTLAYTRCLLRTPPWVLQLGTVIFKLATISPLI